MEIIAHQYLLQSMNIFMKETVIITLKILQTLVIRTLFYIQVVNSWMYVREKNNYCKT